MQLDRDNTVRRERTMELNSPMSNHFSRSDDSCNSDNGRPTVKTTRDEGEEERTTRALSHRKINKFPRK